MSSPRPVTPRRARPVFEGPTYMAPSYHSRVWGRLIFLLFVLLLAVVIGLGGGTYWLLHRAQSSSSRTVALSVGRGDNVGSIATRLQKRGMINSTFLFKLDARIQNLAGKLKVGRYYFKRNMSIDQMVANLQNYQPVTISFTVPEGWRAEQIAADLEAKGFNGKAFLNVVQHPTAAFVSSLAADGVVRDRPTGSSLEGYLFPDTYNLSPGESPEVIARGMINALDVRFTRKMRQDAQARKSSIFQVLTLASIVEREARLGAERPTIAGVYANRLRSGWFLDADPTVQYTKGTGVALNSGPKSTKWWPVLLDQAARVNPSSPYNTYTHKGLPPSPIANPGLASILAAVYPQKTQYMYFVAVKHGHGRHVFARTLDEQNRNISQYGG